MDLKLVKKTKHNEKTGDTYTNVSIVVDGYAMPIKLVFYSPLAFKYLVDHAEEEE